MNKSNSRTASAVAEASPHANAILFDLRNRALLDGQVASTIARASRIALDSSNLLSFAISLVHANPYYARLVDRTIELASSLGRSVDLNWSTARWCRQYRKFMRLVPLYELTLSAEAVYATMPWYNTDWVRACLPADPLHRRSVCLLDSVAKLVRDAYRQHRCISGEEYFRWFACGKLAGFSVLHRGRRWTVILYRTPRDKLGGTAHLFQIYGPRNTRPTNQVRGEVIAKLDTRVFYEHSSFLYSADQRVRTVFREDVEERLPWRAMHIGPSELRLSPNSRGVENGLDAAFDDDAGASKDLNTVKRLVDRNLLAVSTAKLLLRAASNADDPANLLSFAIALRQLDDSDVPVVHALGLMTEQGRKIRLRWSADEWWIAYAGASFLYSGMDSNTPRTRPFRTRSVGQKSSRITAVDTPIRLSREAYRQRSAKVLAYADEIAEGSMQCASVLLDGKRWTVVYSLNRARERDRVSSYIGATGAKPPRSVRRRIRHLIA